MGGGGGGIFSGIKLVLLLVLTRGPNKRGVIDLENRGREERRVRGGSEGE